jgi:light-regulated signal transduction histidine kinase (bacteriophytochrome)
LEQFAYVASHDLQEPLRNITNYVGLLEFRAQDSWDEESKQYFSVIEKSAERMKILIRELLNFSRIGRNRMLEKVDCNKVIKDVLSDMDFALRESNAVVKVSSLPEIDGNVIEMKQLFQNFISNGIKFKKNEVPPEIQIQCTDKNEKWEFAIRDNGIGIREDYLKKIFLIFQRLHSDEEYPGTGIGLATCNKIVALNNGEIWVESTLNVGSTFYFTFPKQQIL